MSRLFVWLQLLHSCRQCVEQQSVTQCKYVFPWNHTGYDHTHHKQRWRSSQLATLSCTVLHNLRWPFNLSPLHIRCHTLCTLKNCCTKLDKLRQSIMQFADISFENFLRMLTFVYLFVKNYNHMLLQCRNIQQLCFLLKWPFVKLKIALKLATNAFNGMFDAMLDRWRTAHLCWVWATFSEQWAALELAFD